MAHIDDQEQWEAIKKWWKENGTITIIIIILAASGSFGFRYWQEAQARKAEEASALYDQLQVAQATPLASQALTQIAKELETNYTSTPYASLAALLEAKNAADKKDLPLALQKLQWVIEHAQKDDVRQIARIRAARVLLAQQQPAAALALLEKVDEKAFMPEINQVKGDIYLSQGNKTQARAAYTAALANLPPAEPIRSYLEMQVHQLAE